MSSGWLQEKDAITVVDVGLLRDKYKSDNLETLMIFAQQNRDNIMSESPSSEVQRACDVCAVHKQETSASSIR